MNDIDDGEFDGIIDRSFTLYERKLLSTTFESFLTIMPQARNCVFNSIPDFLLECPDDYLELSELVQFGFGHFFDIWTINIHWDKLTEGHSSE